MQRFNSALGVFLFTFQHQQHYGEALMRV